MILKIALLKDSLHTKLSSHSFFHVIYQTTALNYFKLHHRAATVEPHYFWLCHGLGIRFANAHKTAKDRKRRAPIIERLLCVRDYRVYVCRWMLAKRWKQGGQSIKIRPQLVLCEREWVVAIQNWVRNKPNSEENISLTNRAVVEPSPQKIRAYKPLTMGFTLVFDKNIFFDWSGSSISEPFARVSSIQPFISLWFRASSMRQSF